MLEAKESINLLGAVIANVNNLLLAVIFFARLYKLEKLEYWLGILFISTILPLIFMFIKSFGSDRAGIYYIQLLLMIAFIIAELLLDYIFKIDFRQNRNIVIPYITLFYASLGGMIGIASNAGKPWPLVTAVSFLFVTALSLFVHFRTGT